MAKVRAGFVSKVEVWQTKAGVVNKIVIRNLNGQLHGATNYPQLAKVSNS